MSQQSLINQLQTYHADFIEEAAFVRRAIKYITQNPNCFERAHRPFHITGSAWVINQQLNKVMLIHHAKLHQWFQPGGHADGETDILNVSFKELTEESGLAKSQIQLLSSEIFDVDIHTIPAIDNVRQHGHIDIRYLYCIDERLPIPGNDESHEVRWIPLEDVKRFNNFRSTYRMVDKTRRLRLAQSRKPAA